MSPHLTPSQLKNSDQGDRKTVAPALWGAVPAVLTLALLYGLREAPLTPAPTQSRNVPLSGVSAISDSPAATFPISSTMIVSAAGVNEPLIGTLQPALKATGEAPGNGQVSKVLVTAGQKVSVGDEVMQLSLGPTTHPPTEADHRQSAAERAQVAAAHQQDQLKIKIQQTESRLREAQSRVSDAQERVAEARSIVARLKSGADVTMPIRPEAVKPAASSGSVKADLQRRDGAKREAEKANRAAAAAAGQLKKASQNVERLEATQKSKQNQLEDATSAVAATQERFDDGSARGSDVEKARMALADVKAAVAATVNELEAAKREVKTRQSAADESKSAARAAGDRLVGTERTVKTSGAESAHAVAAKTESPRATAKPANGMTVAEAAQIVRDAVNESDSAIEAAESIRTELAGYTRQVNRNADRIERTSKGLAAAQQRVMEETIRNGLSNVRSPASGTVTWVANLAREVSEGDPLIKIGQAGLLEARLSDNTDGWRSLHPGDTVAATIYAPIDAQTPAPQNSPLSPLTPQIARNGDGQIVTQTTGLTAGDPMAGSTNPAEVAVPAQGRIREIVPPRRKGEAATIVIDIPNPRKNIQGPHSLRAGLRISCSIGTGQLEAEVTVPATAIHTGDDGANMVAVLQPLDQTMLEGPYRIDWRSVTLGAVAGAEQKVVAGLRPGERVSLNPSSLISLTETYGPNATVGLQLT